MHDEVSVVSGEACRALLRLLIKCSCDACRPRKTKSLRADVPPSPLESAHPAKNRVNPADTGDLGCTTRNCTVDVKSRKTTQPDTHERSNRKSRNPVRSVSSACPFAFPAFRPGALGCVSSSRRAAGPASGVRADSGVAGLSDSAGAVWSSGAQCRPAAQWRTVGLAVPRTI